MARPRTSPGLRIWPSAQNRLPNCHPQGCEHKHRGDADVAVDGRFSWISHRGAFPLPHRQGQPRRQSSPRSHHPCPPCPAHRACPWPVRHQRLRPLHADRQPWTTDHTLLGAACGNHAASAPITPSRASVDSCLPSDNVSIAPAAANFRNATSPFPNCSSARLTVPTFGNPSESVWASRQMVIVTRLGGA